ncbi:MAG: ABC-F family ATP-binding cassette domain-containing protein [Propionibacteriaceae bacterium]|jgi:ATPase subunit of ABC transporter with duplicated ATPase domains|nr:ABC-F family ATP-binding cassette domain-containing protein [Propionibacteriaceae bacterium]
MAHLLSGESLRLEYPTGVVLEDVTLGLGDGDRVGVVGRNGDGKSSLLRMLGRTLKPTSGTVNWRSGLRVGLLSQGDAFAETLSVGQAVVGEREEYEWASDARIREIVQALIADIGFETKLSELSGGQRRRVDLAALLVGDWDVLLLDEPTNHLDIQGIDWLARHLNSRWSSSKGAMLAITHDRWFLDAVSTSTWEVHDARVEPFEGGYAAYVLQRVERDRIAAATEAKRQNLMRKELAWLRRGAPARTSKPKFRIEAANNLIADVPPLRDSTELFQLASARLGKTVIEMEDVNAGYAGVDVLKGINWNLGPGERTGIVGANGAGKSTLLKLLSGELKPSSGKLKRGKTVRVGILHQRWDLDGDPLEPQEDGKPMKVMAGDLVREVLGRIKTYFTVGKHELTATQLLERLGFDRAQLSNAVGELSGGERRRLQLLLVLAAEPNVLILDEPTNDVDTDMLAALEDFLDSWPGTLVIVSHDRYLLERASDQQYAVLDGHLRHLPGGVDEYLELVSTPEEKQTQVKDNTPSESALERAKRKELAALERKLEKASKKVEKLYKKLEAADQSDFQALQPILQDIEIAKSEHEGLENAWLEAAL